MGGQPGHRAQDLSALRTEAKACRGCDLRLTATHLVMGEGLPHAQIMVIGEQPLRTENRGGRPFTGRAGMLMRRALADAGIDPDVVFFTNVVKHSRFADDDPSARHVAPLPGQVAGCRPWLDAELRIVQPRVVVLLGLTVIQAVLGPGVGLRKHRGRRLVAPDRLRLHPAPTIVVTARPTTVHRSRHRAVEYADLVRDLRVAADCLRGG
ncbi:MAG: uracil-DNA glycosylase [Actinomycetota bacterium]|nr:uracil-DNA glycosylase [Actinomycetota bacterium]